jgi:hypothetical protein
VVHSTHKKQNNKNLKLLFFPTFRKEFFDQFMFHLSHFLNLLENLKISKHLISNFAGEIYLAQNLSVALKIWPKWGLDINGHVED